MKFYNSLTRKKEEFVPLKKGEIGMYVCGPTVYDRGHLGHAYAAVSMDVIRRYLKYRGYAVTYVSNITDVDDKMIKRSNEEGITEKELAARIIPLYAKDYADLRVLPADHQPRATEFIPKMVALVEELLNKNYAYQTEDGIYFKVSTFNEYGKLSKKNLPELRAGARVAVDEKKKHAEDFALWKAAKPGEPTWQGPAGMIGRPGWHIECSAMSMTLLGATFDIHGGGVDLQFPHHEDEIAQSESVTGKQFVRYWLHNGHIRVKGEKMSKSLGNFFTIESVFARFDPLVVRFFLLSNHYRQPIDYTPEMLEAARQGLKRVHDFVRRVESACGKGSRGKAESFMERLKSEFVSAMDDDCETPRAVSALFEFVSEIHGLMDENLLSKEEAAEVSALMIALDQVFAILQQRAAQADDTIKALIDERTAARKARDFKRADEIRDELLKRGIELEDSAKGTFWKRML